MDAWPMDSTIHDPRSTIHDGLCACISSTLKNRMKRDRHAHTHTDIATLWSNRPSGPIRWKLNLYIGKLDIHQCAHLVRTSNSDLLDRLMLNASLHKTILVFYSSFARTGDWPKTSNFVRWNILNLTQLYIASEVITMSSGKGVNF